MSVKGEIRLTEDWIKAKNLIKDHLYALSFQLAGRINEAAPAGNMLKGSFTAGDVFENKEGLRVSVGSPIQHGAYVEFGTRPHWMPIQPLLNWAEHNVQIQLKAIGIEFKEGKVFPTKKGSIKLKGNAKTRAINNFAYAVRAVIAKRGTKAQKYIEKSLRSLGLPFIVSFSAIGATYEIDIASYLQTRIENILKQSGMSR